jgi:hypothetical protein
MAKRPRLLEAAPFACVLCVFALPVLVATTARLTAAPRPYLLAVGPAPLRFQSPRPVAEPFVLASLRRRDGPPAASNEASAGLASTLPQKAAPTNTAAPTIISTDAVAGSTSPGEVPEFILPFPSGADRAQAAIIDPQLLLQYLSPVSTNASHAKPTWPAFVPPAIPAPAPPQRSSQATYERR